MAIDFLVPAWVPPCMTDPRIAPFGRDDEANLTDGHEEPFAVMSGRAVFTVDGEEVDAPAGTLVFVRDPALVRGGRAAVDGTAILAIGGRPGVPFEISRWERTWFPSSAGL